MLEVRFHDMIWLNSVIRLQGYITKYIQQVELIYETIQRSTRSELFLRLRIFTIAISSDQSFCTRTIVRPINMAGIPIGMGSYTIGVMIRITGSMRFQDSSYTPLEEPIQQSCWWIPAQGSGGIWKLEASLECSRSPEVYRCRYWDPYHSGVEFYWDSRILGLYVACFCIITDVRTTIVLFSQQQAAIPLIRNRDSIFHTGSQYVLISTAVDRSY